jgi:hypothetical protein
LVRCGKVKFQHRSSKRVVGTATCWDEKGTGERGGFTTTIERQFHLEFNKKEVEKLVDTALNEKLLKKLNINNLKQIDRAGKLEIDVANLREQLLLAHRELKRLKRLIGAARSTLNQA